jgi:hypothetical protein
MLNKASWLILGVLVVVFGLAVPAQAQQEVRVPSDPGARYWVLDVAKVDGDLATITTKRQGKSGTSFARRLVDCHRYVFKYIGDADTLEEMNQQNLQSDWGALVNGSISDYFSRYACNATGQ